MAKGNKHSHVQQVPRGTGKKMRAGLMGGASPGVQGPSASSHKTKGGTHTHKQHTGKAGRHT